MNIIKVLLTFSIWLILSITIGCIPACPFWMFGYNLTGCFVWLFAGLPFGLIVSLAIFVAINGEPVKEKPSFLKQGDVP